MLAFKSHLYRVEIFGALTLLLCFAGCERELQSTRSVAGANDQRFTESLAGNWAVSPFKDEPERTVSIKRKDSRSSDYIAKVRDKKGIVLASYTLRLLEIGDYEFIELEITMPEDTPKEQRDTINGKPLERVFLTWRFTKAKDTLRLWEFEDKTALNTLPQSEVVRPQAKDAKKSKLADCSTEVLRKFLVENGKQMTRKFVELTRYE